jgi:hypothetical protein
MIRVVNVKGMNKPEERSRVAYVGRAFAGWPRTPWGNHQHHACPDGFRTHLLSLPPADLDALLAALWEACEHGAKPLGCWCVTAEIDGTAPTPACHAAVWGELLLEKYGGHRAEA